ncbi:MAG TPA: tetratricopeptide repeat protein, partial [Chloroflexota bacterium]|nr:tetratricopeptide repeat protein [Chloroflexota bacterium]
MNGQRPAGRQVVSRRRLVARLHELVHHRLTLVVAPAGYGKTTLLEELAADCAAGNVALTVCRYAASLWDADGPGLLAGVAEAIRRELPGVGDRTLQLLERARAGGSGADLQRVLDSAVGVLADELRERAADYLLLVVDDYHLLDDSTAARRLVETLLRRLPEHVHLALLSRTVPSLDTAWLVAAGQAAGLGPREIAFSEEELAHFLRQRYRIEAAPEVVAEVRRWTEGWITGLILAMPAPPPGMELSPARRAAALVATLSGARRGGFPLHEYLAAELLRRLEPDDRELLLAAALPEECDAALLDETLARGDAAHTAARLAELERRGVPLAALSGGIGDAGDGAPARFRLHALLRQYLRGHLEKTEPGRHAALQRRWAEVLAAHGAPGEALGHALAAGWWERAALLVERHGDEWVDRGRYRFLEEALTALPPHVLERRARVLIHAGRLALAQGRAPLAVERARRALFVARERRDRTAEARALLLEALATLVSGRADEALQLSLQALEHGAVRRDKLLLAEAHRYLGLLEALRGMLETAVEHLEKALPAYEAAGLPWATARLLNNLAVVYRQLGRFSDAVRCHQRALTIREELGDPSEIAQSLLNLSALRFCAGDLEQAEALVHRSLDLTERSGIATWATVQHFGLGDLHRARGRPHQALEAYRACGAAVGASSDPRWPALALVGEAGALLILDRAADAADAARRALDIASSAGLKDGAGHARAVLAAAALQQGNRREAISELEAARLAARETGSRDLQVRVSLWSGQLAYSQRRWTDATTYAGLAAEAAQALGGPVPLALEGPALVPLLKLAASRGVAP